MTGVGGSFRPAFLETETEWGVPEGAWHAHLWEEREAGKAEGQAELW